MQGVLYISYDGMLEPLGQSQVLAYLERLADGRSIHLLSFEKKDDWADIARRQAVASRIAGAGIAWHSLRYHKSPSALATAFDIAHGTVRALALIKRHRLTLVHARSYVAALIGLNLKRLAGVRLLFDMRGLWADERVDGGLWPRGGRLYRTTKALERRFLEAADQVVTLTEASETEIRGFPYLQDRIPPIAVIPTCADLDRFKPQSVAKAPGKPFVLGYVGSVGTWYLLDEMIAFYAALKAARRDARLLVVNRNDQPQIRARLAAAGVAMDSVELVSAEHRDMPALVGRMDAAMALIKPTYSKIASAPTKLAEYLGCGVPCVGNVGVGDMETILEGRRVGVALRGFSAEEMQAGAKRLLALARDPSTAARCRETAVELFSLERGVAAYAEIYERLR